MKRHVTALVAACGLASALLSAQQPSQPRPTFKSEANYIRVDAFITRDGRPVEDLRVEDFELLEDGKPQTIDAFEHVRIQPAGPQVTRIEPNSQRDANEMAADPRARVFVVFLDIDHVPVEGSYRLKTALGTMLRRTLGQDDLVGVTTSRNRASELILARKTALIEEQLERYWYWGRRDGIQTSPEEDAYLTCYSSYEGGREIAEEMIDRRREREALDALSDLVIHLRGLRDERKAILAITTGWRLFRPNPGLERALTNPLTGTSHVPTGPPIGVGPGGKLRIGDDARQVQTMSACDRDRMALANLDNWQALRDLTQDANRANVTFYPVDPRGLVVFDSAIGPREPPPPAIDSRILRIRQDGLRMLADETDGLSVLNTGDLTKGLRRITDDLSSYYLMGYYSTNTSLDGRYHRITVRVKRPGVEVRARKGYRAATREEVTRAEEAKEAAAVATTASGVSQSAVIVALNRLSLIRPDAAVYVHATVQEGGRLWVAGELPAAAARAATWARGGRVSILAVDAAGATLGVARKTLAAGARDFMTAVPLDDPSKTPDRVQVRLEPEGSPAIGLEVTPRKSEPLLLRRAGTAPPRAAADFRFFRTETLVYRWSLSPGEGGGAARVLDRAGGPMALPATAAEESLEGIRWLTGSLTLAPLTTGDYLLEVTKKTGGADTKALVPFRVVR